jgi:hypothetical protein
MRHRLIRRSLILGILTVVFTVAFPGLSHADPLVLRGFDLFVTDANGTKVNLGPAGVQPFKGVPLGSFDFGNGPVNTFNTDTIVQRLGDASPASPTISLQMVALQLMSVNQFDLGGGTDFHFVTLQSLRGGPLSLGLMTVTFGPEGTPHGTFDSTLSVFFDIRVGALDGPIVFSGSKTISAFNVPWTHFAPPGAVLIPGINFLLNGQDQSNDFFPIGLVMHINPDGSMHTVEVAGVPEPTTISLFAVGIAGVVASVRKRRRQA